MSKPARVYLVLVTCPTVRTARTLAHAAVKSRLAACVNLVPKVESVFWWQGKVNQARETLLLLKTTGARFESLRRWLCRRHPYDIPEILALPIERAHQPYLRWVLESVGV